MSPVTFLPMDGGGSSRGAVRHRFSNNPTRPPRGPVGSMRINRRTRMTRVEFVPVGPAMATSLADRRGLAQDAAAAPGGNAQAVGGHRHLREAGAARTR